MSETARHITYEDAGVDTAEGGRAVDAIKQMVAETSRPEVIGGIGGFGGLFSAAALKDMEDPILISGTDGVGTKLVLAQVLDRHETVGQDLVAMCVNDILASGAEPLFFLDYVAIGHIEAEHMAKVVKGVADGCKLAGCALVGGEMAEHPGVMRPDDYDMAGFTVGVVDRPKMLDPANVRPGDVIIGLPSSGIHSNGYSLVRKILDKSGLGPDDTMPGSDRTVKDVLLEPTYIYSDVVRNLMRDLPVKGMVHITGGGFYDNIPRVLPNSVTADIKFASWDVQPVFHWLREEGGLTWPEMLQIFNCGIGYVFIVPSEVAEEAMGRLEAMHKGAWVIGTIGRRQDKDEEQVKILF